MGNFEKIENRNFIDILLGAVKIVGIMIFTWSILIFKEVFLAVIILVVLQKQEI